MEEDYSKEVAADRKRISRRERRVCKEMLGHSVAEIIRTEMAIEDLCNIADYISKDSQYYTTDFVKRIIDQIERLSLFPKIGRKVPEQNDDNIREIIYHNYRLVYKIVVRKYIFLLYPMEVMIWVRGLRIYKYVIR